MGLASRSVGQVSLGYGYDPEVPAEKLFVMSVVNADVDHGVYEDVTLRAARHPSETDA